MEELFRALGGLPGFFAFLTAAVVLFWRWKAPSIAVDYLQRELERLRGELGFADRDRVALRDEVKQAKARVRELDDDYMSCLTDREKCRRHVRELERQLRVIGHHPVGGEEERG